MAEAIWIGISRRRKLLMGGHTVLGVKVGGYLVHSREKELHYGPFPDAGSAQAWAEEHLPILNWVIRPIMQPTGYSS